MPLRIATPEDASALLAIYTPYVTGSCYTFETEPPTEGEFRERMRGIQRGNRRQNKNYAHSYSA